MNRELQRWTLILAFLAFAFGVLAAFVPQWHLIQDYTRAYGLRKMCVGSYCGALNLTELSIHPECKAEEDCGREAFWHRWRVIEAFIWIAVAGSFFAGVTLLVGFRRDLLHTARVNTTLILLLLAGLAGYIVALAVLGDTVSLHAYEYHCQLDEGCLFWGQSSAVALAGLCVLAIALLLALFSLCTRSPTARGAFLAWCFFLVVASFALALGAALSHKWVIKSLPRSNLETWVSLGVFNYCVGDACHPLDQGIYIHSSCNFRSYDDLQGRFAVAEIFLILGFIFAFVVFILALRNMPVTAFVFIVLAFVFIIVGVSVLGDTFDWWLQCGNTYCDYVSLERPLVDCHKGFTFAAALVAIFLLAILIVAFIIMFCCRKEDRAPDRTQVAVTTIAQPPPPVVTCAPVCAPVVPVATVA